MKKEREFQSNKRYVFTTKRYKKAERDYKFHAVWVDICNGQEVIIKGKYDGRIKVNGDTFFVSPNWCKCIGEVK
ncbi:hypothetical protein [Romboutsia sp.]|uniref:hypothetical protein n=1 Tax=Romboutsia sp. TaxID=1965302 RepID=UPI002BABD539|nr:hypothetical protein [Romboutsia sp.]HSQ89791.1 hypothetical protein [Romboutsia sp.]